MKPVIALVGRPNVGKSTLFNCLTKSREALVADFPGLTRDRKYGSVRHGERDLLVVDTGGLSGESAGIDAAMAEQTRLAVAEADMVLLLVDGRSGLTAADELVADYLRVLSKPTMLVVNKTDGVDPDVAAADFFGLGLGEAFPIAASHGRGVLSLMDAVCEAFPEEEEAAEAVDEDRIRVAVIGRPNVGKSTLINRIMGEDRVLVYDMPGTTRDSVYVPFDRDGVAYTLIDTAGVRRRSRVHETVEKFSIVKTLKAVEEAHVVIVVLDARQEVAEQDISLLGWVLHQGRAIVLAVNKWDHLPQDKREQIRGALDRRLDFARFARVHFISALHGTGVGELYGSVNEAYESAVRDMPTPLLTRLLEELVTAHPPPMVGRNRIKLRYAHQGGKNPPLIVIHGSRLDKMPGSYKRYLENGFREALKLRGTPMRIEFKGSENPYAGRKNTLTPTQQRKRKRLLKHVKKR